MKYFKEMNESQQESITNTFIRNESDIRGVYLGCAERLIKALFLMNGGGAITILAYIYKDNHSPYSIILSASLVIFLIGLMFTFIVVICDFLSVKNRRLAFKNDINNFYANKILVNKITLFDPEKSKGIGSCLIYSSGFISSLCACAGIIIGLWGYFLMPIA